MYVIIELSGRQYRVSAQDTIEVNRPREAPTGTLTLDKVLMVVDGKKITVGQPYIAGARVQAEVVGESKGPKEIIFKFQRRKNMRRKTGHRQPLSLLKIKKIEV